MPCTTTASLITCLVPGATSASRLAAGRYDTDLFADLALLRPNSSAGIAAGAYWLRNQGDGGGFSLSMIGSVTATGMPGKIVVVKAALPFTDSVAALLSDKQLLGWSPYLPDGGIAPGAPAAVPLATPVSDIAVGRLEGWPNEGLVSTSYTAMSTVRAYRGFSSGQAIATTNTSTNEWNGVRAWRTWLMMSGATTAATAGHVVTYDTGGAVTFTSSSLPYLNWKEAQEIDIFNNSTSTQFFMRGGVVYTMVEFPNAMQPTGGNGVANSLSVVNRDGGNIPQGASFVIGPYGLLDQANLFTLLAAGGARQYTNFAKVGGKWEVEEVVRADLNSAGVVFQQGLLADMNGDMKRDLVLIDAGGNIRIYLSP